MLLGSTRVARATDSEIRAEKPCWNGAPVMRRRSLEGQTVRAALERAPGFVARGRRVYQRRKPEHGLRARRAQLIDKFRRVAAHVQNAPGTDILPRLIRRPELSGRAALSQVGRLRIRIVSPRIQAAVAAARRFFPFEHRG